MDVDACHLTADLPNTNEPMVIGHPPQITLNQAVPTNTVRRPKRNQRLPARYRDEVPRSAPPALVSSTDPNPNSMPLLPRVFLIVRDGLKTVLGSFGLWRDYTHCPLYNPDSIVPDNDLAKPVPNHTSNHPRPSHPEPPWPYQNMSTYRFMTWLNTGSKSKSEGEVQRLVDEVLQAQDFNPSDLHGLNVRRENRLLDLSEKVFHSLITSRKRQF